jgi:AraC-like DNA-binding protein
MLACNTVSVSVPGLRVAHVTTDEPMVGVKEYHAVARLERGHREWWVRGKVQRARPRSLQLMQPGDVHRDLAPDGPVTYQVVVLPARDIERAGAGRTVPADGYLAPDDPRGAPFHRLHDAVIAGADRLSLEVLTTEAVLAFATLKSTPPDHTRPVRRAMEYLRERLADAITLDALARHAGLDKFHLCRAFRAQIGMPPHAYLTHLRVWRAKDLLHAGTRPAEVAALVGLYDQSQLNRHFRRIVGTTPARFGR